MTIGTGVVIDIKHKNKKAGQPVFLCQVLKN